MATDPEVPVRLGLVGANRQGIEHARGAQASEAASIVSVCDLSPEVLQEFCCQFPQVRSFRTVEEMCSASELDGLVVAVPHHRANEVLQVAFRRGLPTLKEKPLGRTLAEARTWVEEARKSGVGLVTAIQRREHTTYRTLREHLVGQRVISVSATLHLGFSQAGTDPTWRDSRSAAGGGALLDSGYHLVDLVHFLVGPMEVVHASFWDEGVPAGPNDIETDAVLTGRSGSTWVRIESRVGGTPTPVGPRKWEEVLVETPEALWRADRERLVRGDEVLLHSERSWTDAMTRQLDAFAHRIRTGSFDDPAVWDQLSAMRVVDAAYATQSGYGRVHGEAHDPAR